MVSNDYEYGEKKLFAIADTTTNNKKYASGTKRQKKVQLSVRE